MVTKPTGRPRGRPRKPILAREKKRRGRPPVDFQSDRDRYLIAFFGSLVADGKSERDASRLVAMFSVGNEVPVPAEKLSAFATDELTIFGIGPVGPDDKQGNYKNTKIGSSAATVDGRAATIRAKANSYKKDATALVWLAKMAHLFSLVIWAGRLTPDKLSSFEIWALARADDIGERDYAISIILPMIRLAFGRESGTPDFSTNYPSTTTQEQTH